MKLNRRDLGWAGIASSGIAAAAIIAGCGSGSPQLDDLQNVNPSYPNYAAIYLSPDGFPNIVKECIDGVGFALTTRDASAAAAQMVQQWSSFCVAQEGKQATQHGQP